MEGSRRRARSRAARSAATAAAVAHLAPLAFRVAVALIGRNARAAPAAAPADPPAYTVLGALRGEEARAGRWIDAVAALHHPRERLDVMVLVEADDAPTRRAAERAARRLGEPGWLRVVTVPPGEPRTKPRALAHGLALARGDLLVVYDAEDVPDPWQLRDAAAVFAAGGPRLACVQARPAVVPPRGDALGRVMAAEYRLWHGGFLPGLARLGAPVPLAGTSNHLRVAALRAVGGWDPRNVAEDADLGVRLARAGLRTRTIASPTREESTPEGVAAWVRQRSRWSRGFVQTWLAALRPRGALRRELGAGRAACVHLTIAGTVASQLAAPAAWILCPAAAMAGVLLRLAGCRALRGGAEGLGAAALAAPAASLLEGVAAWRGLWLLARDPGRWERTAHPVRPGSP
ncbi:glycosyltransferase [Miltoncostaea marina]|uniref:glycosyltransferase n=1 Tax=Miltoncostaea marina TaxID=2843215 RepID=UPI001C3E2392|nr:glycosyltransferase [Miltoncostaea marina]